MPKKPAAAHAVLGDPNVIAGTVSAGGIELPPAPDLPVRKGTFMLDSSFTRKLPLWERFGTEQLLAIRDDMTPREFDRGFRQNPISDQDLVFKPDVLDACKDKNFCMVDHVEGGSPFDAALRYAGVDLAIGETESSAFFVCTVIAVDRNMQRWLLWIERHKGISLNKQFEILLDVQVRFNLTLMKVENNAYQKALQRHIEEYNVSSEKIVHIPVEGYTTTSFSKHDEEFGVPSLGIEFEQKRWHLPMGDKRSERLIQPLLEELSVYPLPGYRTDCVISLFLSRECHNLNRLPKARIIDLIR